MRSFWIIPHWVLLTPPAVPPVPNHYRHDSRELLRISWSYGQFGAPDLYGRMSRSEALLYA